MFFSLIKTLMNPKKMIGDYGYMLTQLEMAEQYIHSINHESLNVTMEEFDKRISTDVSENK